MSWAHVQGKSNAGSSATFTSSVTAGNIIVVGISSANGVASITDSGSNAYTLVKTIGSGPNNSIYYSVVTTGGTLTVTISGATVPAIAIDEYSFTPGIISVSSTNAISAGSLPTNPSTGPVTYTATKALIYGALSSATTVAFTPATNFILRQQTQWVNSVNYGILSFDYPNPVSSPQTPSGTCASSGTPYAISGVAFQSSGDTGSKISGIQSIQGISTIQF